MFWANTPAHGNGRLKPAQKANRATPQLVASAARRGRTAETGRTLSAGAMLRVDLTRAVLGQTELIVIDNTRLSVDLAAASLIQKLRRLTHPMVLISGPLICPDLADGCITVADKTGRDVHRLEPAQTQGT
ncbi:hypothetical protein [Litoreibacter roseus]|uniref:Uncharacterized protein n=1 Tax=Litoreibacter roseus TaxID=2601869 RepID=A0A6N6JHC9_9RHOB|nr:hypothetical protein [Litoreibacter roseus]GFE65524.1 hypothetical protein KIN_25980 [Litoreibacter roseus]